MTAFVHLLAEEIFRGRLQLAQNHRGNFGRAVHLAGNFDARVIVLAFDDLIRHALHFLADFVEAAAHEALDRINGVFRIRHRLALGHLTDEALAALGDCDYRRRGARPFLVRDHHRFAALHDRDDRVGRAQVNSDNLAHCCCPP